MGKDDQKRNKQTERKPTGKLGEGDGGRRRGRGEGMREREKTETGRER